VQTEEFIKHQVSERRIYVVNRLNEVDWLQYPDWMQTLFSPGGNTFDLLRQRSVEDILTIISFCARFHVEDQLFNAFHQMLDLIPLPALTEIQGATQVHPPLVFSLLKKFPPENRRLSSIMEDSVILLTDNLIRCANGFAIAVLVALEKIAASLIDLPLGHYCRLLELAASCIRSRDVAQEVLLVLNDIRMSHQEYSASYVYAHKHALAIAFDRVEEAADECPCDELGNPTKQRIAPSRVQLHSLDDDNGQVRVDIRIDLPSAVRLHSLVRLQAASRPDKGWTTRWMMDGVVTEAKKGELKVKLFQPPPSEMSDMDWLLYNAGSIGDFSCLFTTGAIFENSHSHLSGDDGCHSKTDTRRP
jgi:hypothetical protein